MTYRDVLKNHRPVEINVRAALTFKTAEALGEKETFIGAAKWDGEKLISLDGDSYSLGDEIAGFLELHDHLIIWEKTYEI